MNPSEFPLICPVCDAETNSQGNPFVSEWALSCHIAGSAIVGNLPHRRWIKKVLGDVDFSRSNLSIAEDLEPEVHKALKDVQALQTPNALAQDIEVKLHNYIKERLMEYYGETRSAWWVKGVPQKIRMECANRLESDNEDDRQEEPYQYTYFIDLKEIVDKKWEVFEPFASQVTLDERQLSKKVFLDWLQKANSVRNRHAHHIRAPKEGSQRYRDDLETVTTMKRIIDSLCDMG
jgi:hypothetical protein